MSRSVIGALARKIRRLDGHEVLHQQIALGLRR
jgi:hypothetical protein